MNKTDLLLNTYMPSGFRAVYNWYWNVETWLPIGTNWTDISNSKINYPDPNDCLYFLPIAIIILGLRAVVKRFIFKPWGQHLGLGLIQSSVESDQFLEIMYLRNNGCIDVDLLSKKTDINSSTIEIWLEQRKLYEKGQRKLRRFAEFGWLFTYYTTSLMVGICALWDKPWVWDIKECFTNFPFHDLTNDVRWYFILICSYNLSELITILTEPKEPEFWEMLLHHIIAFFSYFIGWFGNFIRVGTLGHVIFDAGEIFIQPTKMAITANYNGISTYILGISLFLSWTLTRVIVFPIHIVYSLYFEAPKHITISLTNVAYLLRAMITALFLLQVFWTFYIYKIALMLVQKVPVNRKEISKKSG